MYWFPYFGCWCGEPAEPCSHSHPYATRNNGRLLFLKHQQRNKYACYSLWIFISAIALVSGFPSIEKFISFIFHWFVFLISTFSLLLIFSWLIVWTVQPVKYDKLLLPSSCTFSFSHFDNHNCHLLFSIVYLLHSFICFSANHPIVVESWPDNWL